MTHVLLAFGSNSGDREKTIADAWEMLSHTQGITVLQLSLFYETEPVGGPEAQGMYINAAGTIGTALLPLPLLTELHKIETAFGRIRRERWGTRTLDIDILLYGDTILNTPELTIPHPEMLNRRFVLQPANDIAADWIHPVSELTIGKWLAKIKSGTSCITVQRITPIVF
jgi:2-amino-4-hydroxy-6-hydroxymethyldihydropteridine diphosphokinase